MMMINAPLPGPDNTPAGAEAVQCSVKFELASKDVFSREEGENLGTLRRRLPIS
jgi:hypothetical protein